MDRGSSVPSTASPPKRSFSIRSGDRAALPGWLSCHPAWLSNEKELDPITAVINSQLQRSELQTQTSHQFHSFTLSPPKLNSFFSEKCRYGVCFTTGWFKAQDVSQQLCKLPAALYFKLQILVLKTPIA